jgi:hypothetical protein
MDQLHPVPLEHPIATVAAVKTPFAGLGSSRQFDPCQLL